MQARQWLHLYYMYIHTAMAVVRVRAQAHITCYKQLRKRRSDDFDALHHRIVVRVGMASGRILCCE